jgi:hypothetical protein
MAAKKGAASREALAEIHRRTTDLLLKRLRDAEEDPKFHGEGDSKVLLNPPLSAAEIQAITKFLKDSDFDALADADENAGRGTKKDIKFPFPVEVEDPAESFKKH